MKFRAFGLVYDAPFETSFISSDAPASVVVRSEKISAEGETIHHALDFEDGPSLVVKRDGETCFIEYRELTAKFSSRSEIAVDLEASTTHDKTKLLERVVLPLHLLLTHHCFAIHGSAVAREHATILIGDSGVGKSTTAFELVKRGAKLVTDDLALVRDGKICGAAPTLRTWDDVSDETVRLTEKVAPESGKNWVLLREDIAQLEPASVKQILSLRRGPKFSMQEITGAEKIAEILDQTFDLTHPTNVMTTARFSQASKFAREHALFLCTLPEQNRNQAYDALWQHL